MGFQKRVEDFVCEQCGKHVKGDGFTNHCSKCLWSKHVDVSPGDRASKCLGMMKPARVEGSTPRYEIIHECISCGFTARNKVSPEDNPEALFAIVKSVAMNRAR